MEFRNNKILNILTVILFLSYCFNADKASSGINETCQHDKTIESTNLCAQNVRHLILEII